MTKKKVVEKKKKTVVDKTMDKSAKYLVILHNERVGLEYHFIEAEEFILDCLLKYFEDVDHMNEAVADGEMTIVDLVSQKPVNVVVKASYSLQVKGR